MRRRGIIRVEEKNESEEREDPIEKRSEVQNEEERGDPFLGCQTTTQIVSVVCLETTTS